MATSVPSSLSAARDGDQPGLPTTTILVARAGNLTTSLAADNSSSIAWGDLVRVSSTLDGSPTTIHPSSTYQLPSSRPSINPRTHNGTNTSSTDKDADRSASIDFSTAEKAAQNISSFTHPNSNPINTTSGLMATGAKGKSSSQLPSGSTTLLESSSTGSTATHASIPFLGPATTGILPATSSTALTASSSPRPVPQTNASMAHSQPQSETSRNSTVAQNPHQESTPVVYPTASPFAHATSNYTVPSTELNAPPNKKGNDFMPVTHKTTAALSSTQATIASSSLEAASTTRPLIDGYLTTSLAVSSSHSKPAANATFAKHNNTLSPRNTSSISSNQSTHTHSFVANSAARSPGMPIVPTTKNVNHLTALTAGQSNMSSLVSALTHTSPVYPMLHATTTTSTQSSSALGQASYVPVEASSFSPRTSQTTKTSQRTWVATSNSIASSQAQVQASQASARTSQTPFQVSRTTLDAGVAAEKASTSRQMWTTASVVSNSHASSSRNNDLVRSMSTTPFLSPMMIGAKVTTSPPSMTGTVSSPSATKPSFTSIVLDTQWLLPALILVLALVLALLGMRCCRSQSRADHKHARVPQKISDTSSMPPEVVGSTHRSFENDHEAFDAFVESICNDTETETDPVDAFESLINGRRRSYHKLDRGHTQKSGDHRNGQTCNREIANIFADIDDDNDDDLMQRDSEQNRVRGRQPASTAAIPRIAMPTSSASSSSTATAPMPSSVATKALDSVNLLDL